MLAIFLAMTGTLLLGYAVFRPFITRVNNTVPGDDQCGMPAPDGDYTCTDYAGHYGWCSAGELEWAGDAWAIGADDDTRCAPTKVAPAPADDRQTLVPILAVFAFILAIGVGIGACAGADHVEGRIANQEKSAQQEAPKSSCKIVQVGNTTTCVAGDGRCSAMHPENCAKTVDGRLVSVGAPNSTPCSAPNVRC